MFQFISVFQYFKPGESTQLYREIENLYYRGLCPSPGTYNQVEYFFCYNRGPEILTFNQATVAAPLILISFLYLPSVIYVLILSFRFNGSKNFFEKLFKNPVLFLFPLLTSFSFYKIVERNETEPAEIENMRKIQSLAHSQGISMIRLEELNKDDEKKNPTSNEEIKKQNVFSIGKLPAEDDTNIATTSGIKTQVKKNPTIPDPQANNFISEESNREMTNNPTAVNKTNAWTNEPNFSLLQSNILYLMFFLGSFLCLGADMIVQKARNGFISNNTQFFLSILLLNIILWIDFNFKVFRKARTAGRS